jgi:hypothetical protein
MSRVTEIRYVGYGVTDLDAEAPFTPMSGVWSRSPVTTWRWFKAQGHDEHHVVPARQ